MDAQIQILYESTAIETLLTSFEKHSLLNNYKGQNHSEGVSNIKSHLNFESSKGVTELDFFHSKINLFLKLKEINMCGCGLTEVPSAMFNLNYLTVLNLSNNLLESLPEELGNLHNLVTLKLSGNNLNSLPQSLKHIQQLNYLDLSCNKFSEIPTILYYSLGVLKVLNFSSNLLTEFNDPPACLSRIIVLVLSDNNLNQLPLWIFDNLCQLQILDISNNQLGLDVKFINYCSTGIFESLQLLKIENCNYSCENVQVFSQFRHLKVLHCGNKNLTKGASGKNYFGNLKMEAFKNFTVINELYLQNVGIATLPLDFNCFQNIQLLDLSDNMLSWLPESFCNLITLRVLNLTSNCLLFLPNNIGNLVNLYEIHLSNNKLHQIPESFYDLINLQFLDLYNNQIEKINFNIFKEKNLKGVDLGLNCLQFCCNECGVDEAEVLYNCLKKTFRKRFCCTDSRNDFQKMSPDSERSTGSFSVSRRCSCSSFEGKSDSDDLCTNALQQSFNEDENWEKENCSDEGDEIFDPNELNKFQSPRKSWSLDLRNNYCPAKCYVPSTMTIFRKKIKLTSQNEAVEGQFDSD